MKVKVLQNCILQRGMRTDYKKSTLMKGDIVEVLDIDKKWFEDRIKSGLMEEIISEKIEIEEDKPKRKYNKKDK